MMKTVRFHTGERVIRLRYDPDDPMGTKPRVGEVEETKRSFVRDALVIGVGIVAGNMALRWFRNRRTAEPEPSDI